MRRVLVLFALAAVLVSTRANATTWLGANLGFPVPGHDAGSDQLGLDAGATLHVAAGRHVGLGLDVLYHYFPTSADYRVAFDRYLYLAHVSAIDGPSYSFKALQVTPHLRLTEPLGERGAVWAQAGAGAYFVNRNLAEPDWTGSYFRSLAAGSWFKQSRLQPGWNLGLGLDAHPSDGTTLGIDVTYHRIAFEDEHGFLGSETRAPTFNAITAGMHVLFGW